MDDSCDEVSWHALSAIETKPYHPPKIYAKIDVVHVVACQGKF